MPLNPTTPIHADDPHPTDIGGFSTLATGVQQVAAAERKPNVPLVEH